jgi:homoserine dehydrogenase
VSTSTPYLRVGLAGLGTVGASVWRQLISQADLLRQRTGTEIRVTQIAVRRAERAREVGVPENLVVADWRALVANPEVDVVVELIGGTTDAFELIRQALQNGKHVITANKALLAEHGAELFQIAQKFQRHLLFEASVAGGIPIIRALREGLVANRILSIHGIINGTCNYILTRMQEGGLEFGDALAEAKREGYAEADDSLDVDGHDTAHKAAVLAALAYGFWVRPEQLYTEACGRSKSRTLSTPASSVTASNSSPSSRPIATARWKSACIRPSSRSRTCWPPSAVFSTPCSCEATWSATRFIMAAAQAAIRPPVRS